MANVADILTNNLDVWTSAIERRSAAGRGRSRKFSLYGINRLRALILDLAVRGKLVPQKFDEHIEANILTLARSGATKRDIKERKSISVFDMNYEIPENWIRSKFGALFALEYGDNLPDKARSQTGEYPVYGSNGIVGSHDSASVRAPCIVVGRKGSAGAINVCRQDGCWVTDVAYYCIPPRGIDLHFAAILFQTLGLDELGKGIKPGLNRNEAYVLDIGVPPLAEQHRIVAKVDELMALCDRLEAQTYDAIEAHELLVGNLLATLTRSQNAEELAKNWARIETHFDTLFTTEASIDQLKQTILQLAVMGKLVPQDPNEDRANQRRLRPDEAAESYDAKSYAARAKKFPLPAGWTIEPMSRVSSNIVDCPHTTPKWATEGYLCAKSEQIMPGYLDLRNPNYVSEDTFIERIERLKPEPEDILFKREGGILGVACRIPKGTELCLGQRLMLIRANESVLPPFLELVLNSPWTTDYAREMTTGGAAPRVNMAVVRAFPIPLPPKSEQQRILNKLTELADICELLKAKLSIARTAEVKFADALTSKAVA